MLATKKLFPYQTFQGDHVVEPSDNEDDSSEDEEDVTNSLFCMAVGMDPDVLQEQRQNTALKEISKRVTQLDPELVATLPPHYRWLVDSFAAVAVENPLVFETATNHELILDEFKEKPRCPDASAGVADIQKLGKFWKAGTYGEITCPAMDIIGNLAVERPGRSGARAEDIVWYDLGSGVGKAVLQFALQYRIKRAVGIELARSRHDIAVAAKDWLIKHNAPFLSAEKPAVVCGSFIDPIYQDATHVFANSLLFGPELEREVSLILAGCPRLFQIVATTKLPVSRELFYLRAKRLQLPVSWQEQPQQAFVFERRESPPPTFSLAAAQAAEIGGLALDRASFECAQKVFLMREL